MAVAPLTDAPIEVVTVFVWFRVVIVNVPVVVPARIVVVAGTVAADVLLDVKLTVRPPTGAAELMVNVPVELTVP